MVKETGHEHMDQLRLVQDTYRLAGYITLHYDQMGMIKHQNLMWDSN
jgi:hypothetical protein